jgi:hypothetical protein
MNSDGDSIHNVLKLTTLTVRFDTHPHAPPDYHDWDTQAVMRLVHWFPALKSLTLEIDNYQFTGNEITLPPGSAPLTHLERFTLKVVDRNGAGTYDIQQMFTFLSRMPNLWYLGFHGFNRQIGDAADTQGTIMLRVHNQLFPAGIQLPTVRTLDMSTMLYYRGFLNIQSSLPYVKTLILRVRGDVSPENMHKWVRPREQSGTSSYRVVVCAQNGFGDEYGNGMNFQVARTNREWKNAFNDLGITSFFLDTQTGTIPIAQFPIASNCPCVRGCSFPPSLKVVRKLQNVKLHEHFEWCVWYWPHDPGNPANNTTVVHKRMFQSTNRAPG